MLLRWQLCWGLQRNRAAFDSPGLRVYGGRVGISLTRVDLAGADNAELTAFLTSNEFPFHVRARPTAPQIENDIRAGSWHG